MRIAYLQEDSGELAHNDIRTIQAGLPTYYENHLNKDLLVYVARDQDTIVSCAFLLLIEKPMSPAFITGKTATVMNVYTKPSYRRRGCAKKLMTQLLQDAKELDISVVELKATEDGYPLYQSIGFEEASDRYHHMRIVLQKSD